MNAEEHESKHVTADPLADHPSSLETEVRVLKQIIRALVPDRHALGCIEGHFGADGAKISFNVTVTVPLDPSDDELGARAIAAALRPQLQRMADRHAEAINRVARMLANRAKDRTAMLRDVLAFIAVWSAAEDIDASGLTAEVVKMINAVNEEEQG